MEVKQINNFSELLLKLIDNNYDENEIDTYNQTLEYNLYLTLLAFSNFKYNEEIYLKEKEMLDDFLRKVNNLKIKIQLKRKEKEIDDLLAVIQEIYNTNKDKIEKYNDCNLEVISLLESKDPKSITTIIDDFTKRKRKREEMEVKYLVERQELSLNIIKNDSYIENNTIYIKNVDKEIKIDEFKEMYEYLLDIDNYEQIFVENKSNRERIILISEIISYLKSSNRDINKVIVPLTLTYLLSQNIEDIENIRTSSFNINNIKITDLYSFASNKQLDDGKHAKWNKIVIPNEYLIPKIRELVSHGMFYSSDDMYVFENVDNNVSDFKISIVFNQIIDFLRDILNNIKFIENEKQLTN